MLASPSVSSPTSVLHKGFPWPEEDCNSLLSNGHLFQAEVACLIAEAISQVQ